MFEMTFYLEGKKENDVFTPLKGLCVIRAFCGLEFRSLVGWQMVKVNKQKCSSH